MYTCILYITDLDEHHFTWCQNAAKIAKQFNSPLHLLHVIEPPQSLQLAQGLALAEFDRPLKDDAELVMRTLGEALQIPISQQWVEIGSIKHHTIDKIKSLQCDLLIIGQHNPSGLPAFLDSSARETAKAVSCDVLTFNRQPNAS